MRLAAGFCPYPLGELMCSLRPHSHNGGLLLRGGREEGGRGPPSQGDGKKGREERGHGKGDGNSATDSRSVQ